jgi:hypothetical protein
MLRNTSSGSRFLARLGQSWLTPFELWVQQVVVVRYAEDFIVGSSTAPRRAVCWSHWASGGRSSAWSGARRRRGGWSSAVRGWCARSRDHRRQSRVHHLERLRRVLLEPKVRVSRLDIPSIGAPLEAVAAGDPGVAVGGVCVAPQVVSPGRRGRRVGGAITCSSCGQWPGCVCWVEGRGRRPSSEGSRFSSSRQDPSHTSSVSHGDESVSRRRRLLSPLLTAQGCYDGTPSMHC